MINNFFEKTILFFFVCVFLLLINIDGIINAIYSGHLMTGGYNYIVSILFCFVLLFFILFFYIGEKKIKKNNYIPISFFTFITITMTMFVVLFVKGGEYEKFLRDFFYFLNFLLFSLFFYYLVNNGNKYILFKDMFVFVYIFIVPVLGLFLNNFDHENRFTGLQMASSIFGVSFSLMFIIIATSKYKIKYKYLLLFFCVFYIWLSGTRIAFVNIAFFYLFLLFNMVFISKLKLKPKYFVFLGFILLFSIFIINEYMDKFLAFRMFSLDDGGSASTRFRWYYQLYTQIKNTYFIGGFGSGYSEQLIGNIPHFDLLRFWLDYGVFFILAFFLLIYFVLRLLGCVSLVSYFFAIILFVLLSLHNAFQSPALIFLYTFVLVQISINRNFNE